MSQGRKQRLSGWRKRREKDEKGKGGALDLGNKQVHRP